MDVLGEPEQDEVVDEEGEGSGALDGLRSLALRVGQAQVGQAQELFRVREGNLQAPAASVRLQYASKMKTASADRSVQKKASSRRLPLGSRTRTIRTGASRKAAVQRARRVRTWVTAVRP